VYQKFLEIDVSSTSRLRGVFSESRKILPHSMERQLSLKRPPSTGRARYKKRRQRLKIYEKNF
jgi:hypothetical protein